MSRTRVALIGADGHGLWHRRHLAARQERVDVVALCDPTPIADAPDAPIPAGAGLFSEHREMLAATRPEVVIICTPPHTHLAIATDVLEAGADLLLEKPPVLSVAEHHALMDVQTRTGRIVQVGFQALGSLALTRLLDTISSGALGRVTGVAALASWQRSDAYYERSPWAGRREVDGQPVLDGAVVNPLAHAVMQALVVAGPARVAAVEVERYRTRPIETEDTACMRIASGHGPPVVVAVTLCGEDLVRGEIVVHGTAGRAVLEYPTDHLLLPGDDVPREVPGRVSLLDNLLEHRADPGARLIVPLRRTLPFTVVVDALGTAPDPVDIDPRRITTSGQPPEQFRTIRGINEILRRSADEMTLFHESGVDWAAPPYRWASTVDPSTVDPSTVDPSTVDQGTTRVS